MPRAYQRVVLLTLFRNNPLSRRPILQPYPDVTGLQNEKKDLAMDVLIGLLQAALTIGAVAVVIMLVAGLFMIVFSLGTMFDRRVNNQ